ncbi:sigma-70 family RNA polymerase sigma factor [Actinotalea ferrariae]|uniref:sigma-70 family RNA polymerase sigma factor n=1 Tax=Actinotalea ferrariae TaxID=1386098 RepID=UPI001C8B126A|nr:sigma-70 family RNA polymerase sigma factor [Actinotalea ferrariae]MBX9244659.1 sigma-70 family RNA polymerase sigma factor [Actinotalea ferrariae]
MPTSSGAPVQRDSDDGAWLDEREHEDAAERLDRLAEDYNLVQMLAFEGFEGREYAYFETELAKYGMAVISGWLRRRVIFTKCRERGFGGLPEPPLDAFENPDTVDGLSGETVAKALDRFRSDVLIPGRWDYRKGASLRTYFIGQCLIRFSNVYRRWWVTEGRVRDIPHDVDDDDLLGRHLPSVEGLVLDQLTVDRTLSSIKDPRVRKALAYRGAGLSNAEIGVELGVTEKTVERMIANERDRVRRRNIA